MPSLLVCHMPSSSLKRFSFKDLSLGFRKRKQLPKAMQECGSPFTCVVARWVDDHVHSLYLFSVPHESGHILTRDFQLMFNAIEKNGYHIGHPMLGDWREQVAVALDDLGPMTCPAYAANPLALALLARTSVEGAFEQICLEPPKNLE